MSYTSLAQSTADWALSKVGCAYSQARRTQENIFDCSSLVARAYSAQGKRWKYGGSVPTSNKEIYDDDFELLWPATYAQIGKSFGGASVINMAKQPGDLQFLCTDSGTSRANKITHVTMVATPTQIVHARGTKYGVCTNSISLYAGKVFALALFHAQKRLRRRNNAENAIKRRLWSSVRVDRRPASVPCKAQAARRSRADACLARLHLRPRRFFVPEDGMKEWK